jgi:hypothetical protein
MEDGMTKAKLNKEIAKYFGFKESTEKRFKVGKLNQWTFPDNFPLRQCGVPQITIPDFIKILGDYIELMGKHGSVSNYPRHHGE